MLGKDEAKGRAKESAGAVTGDSKLKHEGQIEQVAGKAKRGIDKAADKAKDALRKR